MTNYRKLCADMVRYWDADDQFAFTNTLNAARWALRDGTALLTTSMDRQLLHPLLRAGYETVEQVLEADVEQLLMIKGLGPDRVGRIKSYVRKMIIKQVTDGTA
jgi:hypothetical protein